MSSPGLGLTTAHGTTTAPDDDTTSTSTGDEPEPGDGTTTTGTTTTGGEPETTAEPDETTGSTSTGDDSTTTGSTSTGEAGTTGDDTTTGGPACACLPGMIAAKNVCGIEPTPECEHTMPGGLCDPDGDGAYLDGDWNAGYFAYLDVCA